MRFDAKCNAFWCKMQCVLVLNAMRFDAKCTFLAQFAPKNRHKSVFHRIKAVPSFAPNKPLQELNFCDRKDDWWILKHS